jgi:hypothetical protein
MNGATGDFGKVLLLNDLYPMATRLMPAMVEAADAFCLTKDATQHAHSRLQASLKLSPLATIMQEIEDGNAEHRETSRGLEGPVGNFSRVTRNSVRQLESILIDQVATAARLGAPKRVLDALSPTSVTTLDVERFFIGQRANWPNPYAAQYGQAHALAMLIESIRRGDAPFSVYTSSSRASLTGRSHYHHSGIRSVAERRYQPKRGKPRKVGKAKRRKVLAVLHKLAALFKQARQQRVTDRGREKQGTQPAPFYGPKVPSSSAIADGDAPLSKSRPVTASSFGRDVAPLYRSGDLVFVRPLRGVLWVAQLTEPVIETSPGCFNVDRPKCRYFVPTSELGAYPHALEWWQQRGQGLRIDDEAAAITRAAQSSGVHFSFEKVNSQKSL